MIHNEYPCLLYTPIHYFSTQLKLHVGTGIHELNLFQNRKNFDTLGPESAKLKFSDRFEPVHGSLPWDWEPKKLFWAKILKIRRNC